MSRSCKEEWERKKTYLIRSLFEDLPVLSPVYEVQESTLSSPQVQDPRPPSPHDYIYRTESPLPELIIEKETKKLYLEDESEEFYNRLEKEMRRLYKRDFLNIDYDTNSSMNKSIETENQSYTQRGSLETEKISLVAAESDQDISKNDTNELEELIEEESRHDDSISTNTDGEASESEGNCAYEFIETQADVHVYFDKMSEKSLHDESYQNSQYEESDSTKSTVISSSNTNNKESHDSVVNQTDTEQEEPKELIKNTDVSAEHFCSDSREELNQVTPEIMRRQIPVSQDSIPFHELPIYENSKISENVTMEVDNMMLGDIIISGREMEIADSFPDLNISRPITSTPKSGKKSINSRSRIIKRNKKRPVSHKSSSSESRYSFYHRTVQTSFSDDELEMKNLWSNFFVGTPVAYNICTCMSHSCS